MPVLIRGQEVCAIVDNLRGHCGRVPLLTRGQGRRLALLTRGQGGRVIALTRGQGAGIFRVASVDRGAECAGALRC